MFRFGNGKKSGVYLHSPIEGTFFEASETEKKVVKIFGSNEKLLNFAAALDVKKTLAERASSLRKWRERK